MNCRELISTGREDYSFFILCDCQFEVIQFYYYKKKLDYPEIIGLKFFGHIDNKISSIDRTVQFTEDNFKDLVDFISEETDYFELRDGVQILKAERKTPGYLTIKKIGVKNKKEFVLWDVEFHKSTWKELINKLNIIQKMIEDEKRC